MKPITLARAPALEAAKARLRGFWSARSTRERAMLAGLGVLLGGVVLFYGVDQPLRAMRARAFADIHTYEVLNARLRAAGRLELRQGGPVAVVSQTAQRFGVAVDVRAAESGVHASVADASYDAVMQWLAAVGASGRVRIQHATIVRAATPGRVSASVEFGA